MASYSRSHGRLSSNVGSLAVLFCLLIELASIGLTHGGLLVGFYALKCPSVENVVRNAVQNAYAADPGVAPELIRLHFHDCFVRGCDASLLLDKTPAGIPPEKNSTINSSVGGFDVIDQAKSLLEVLCPGVVSCADIVAFAARDSFKAAGGINYFVPAGRRDGLVSDANDVALNLPSANFSVAQLQANFANKGLTLEDMVTLSGAHTIGDCHCSAISDRLYNFQNTNAPDPSMDPNYVTFLKGKCPPPGSGGDPAVFLDIVTPLKADNQYYENLKNHRGLLSSDQVLMGRDDTAIMVKSNALFGTIWMSKFADAMVKMGNIEVLTGSQGQIRKSCRVVN